MCWFLFCYSSDIPNKENAEEINHHFPNNKLDSAFLCPPYLQREGSNGWEAEMNLRLKRSIPFLFKNRNIFKYFSSFSMAKISREKVRKSEQFLFGYTIRGLSLMIMELSAASYWVPLNLICLLSQWKWWQTLLCLSLCRFLVCSDVEMLLELWVTQWNSLFGKLP